MINCNAKLTFLHELSQRWTRQTILLVRHSPTAGRPVCQCQSFIISSRTKTVMSVSQSLCYHYFNHASIAKLQFITTIFRTIRSSAPSPLGTYNLLHHTHSQKKNHVSTPVKNHTSYWRPQSFYCSSIMEHHKN